MKMKRYNLTYRLLTPVHIGTGETINPLSYVIDSKNVFHRFRLENLISSLSEEKRKEFIAVAKEVNLPKQRNFIRTIFNQPNYEPSADSYRYPVDADIAKWYADRIAKNTSELEITPTIRSGGDGEPYLPASSVKGAIRTAILDKLLKDNSSAKSKLDSLKPDPKTNQKNDKRREIEGVLLNCWDKEKNYFNVIDDPFKNIKVSDAFFVYEVDMLLRNVMNCSEEGEDIPQYTEMINNNKYNLAEGDIILSGDIKIGNQQINLEYISNACTDYYKQILQTDPKLENLCKGGFNWIDYLKKTISKKADNEFPICIGRFTGCYSKMYSCMENRFPGTRNLIEFRKKKNDKEEKFYVPLGWVMIKYEEIG